MFNPINVPWSVSCKVKVLVSGGVVVCGVGFVVVSSGVVSAGSWISSNDWVILFCGWGCLMPILSFRLGCFIFFGRLIPMRRRGFCCFSVIICGVGVLSEMSSSFDSTWCGVGMCCGVGFGG